MDDRFRPALKQAPAEALQRDKAGASGIACVDDEYADQFDLNDIGLAMLLSRYRPLV